MNIYPEIKKYLQSNKVSYLTICLFFFLVCFFLYFNALNNNFVFDDNLFIVKNESIKKLSLPGIFMTDIADSLHQDVGPLNKYYRPLLALSYAVDYSLWKLNPLGYRMVNISIHAINSFLLYLLIYSMFKDSLLALLSAILFSVHPVHVSLASFISGRSHGLEILFMLSSLVTFVNYVMHNRQMFCILSMLSFILALLSYEGALLLPLFILVCAFLLNINKKKIIIYSIVYFLISIFYIILRAKFMPSDKFTFISALSIERVVNFIWLTLDYFTRLILPVNFQVALFGKSALFNVILLSVSFIVIFYFLINAIIFKEKIAIFALTFCFIGLLPIINLIGLLNFLGRALSEHYLYIASIGFSVFVSYLILKLARRFKKIALVLWILIISIYSVLTVINNTNYKDDLTFYNYILSVDEKHNFARLNLGFIYLEKGIYDKAIEQANLVLASGIGSDAWKAHLFLGDIFNDQGDLNRAMDEYKKALVSNPQSAEALNNLGLIYETIGKDREALESFTKAVQINPQAQWAFQNLVNLLIKKKLYNEAIVLYEKKLDLDPNDADAWLNTGIILAESGRLKEAGLAFAEALKLRPHSFEILKNSAAFYGNIGNFDKAISLWEQALRIKPDDEVIKMNIKKAKDLKINIQ